MLVYDVGGTGVCVCCGGGIISTLYPWKLTDEYTISLLYISCNICIYLYFYFLNIHKSTKLGFKYTTSLVVNVKYPIPLEVKRQIYNIPKTLILASKVQRSTVSIFFFFFFFFFFFLLFFRCFFFFCFFFCFCLHKTKGKPIQNCL